MPSGCGLRWPTPTTLSHLRQRFQYERLVTAQGTRTGEDSTVVDKETGRDAATKPLGQDAACQTNMPVIPVLDTVAVLKVFL